MTERWTTVFEVPRAPSSSSASASGTKVQGQVTPVNDSLVELHKPPGTPQMQVLFFHGLQFKNSTDMHLSTWECGDGSYWPQTWLVEEFPGAHILSVSYNGGIERDSLRVLDMYRVGENLTSDFIQGDLGQMLDCPVIMIGHSFGGLVMKQLCCQAHDKLHSIPEGLEKAKLQSFLRNIRGIFYFATPHHGSKVVEKMAEAQANPLLKYFQTLSADAARLNSKFDQIRGLYGNWRIFGLGESLPTKLSRFRDDIMVPEASARVEPFYTVLGADHFSICKPESKTSAGFSKLKAFLENIARDAEVEANNRKEVRAGEDNRFDNFQDLPKYICGIDDQLQEILDKLLEAKTLGLFGMGGLGKSTMAKALFNKLGPAFEYTCFVPNVKEIVGDENILKKKVWKWMHCDGEKVGTDSQWSALKEKKLVLVLDDIASERDIALISNLVDVTSPESRFIVTSREGELEKSFESSHQVSFLNETVARELFLKHAFPNETRPPKTLGRLVDDIVSKCDRLPLALEVLGNYLCKRQDLKEWEQTHQALEQAEVWSNVDEKLWAKLRISYNGLTSKEQQIFLDVTTFLSKPYRSSGDDRDYDDGWFWTLHHAKTGWRVAYDVNNVDLLWQNLVKLSLVYDVKEDEKIQVHEQIRHLGRMIAFGESTHLRIWNGWKGMNVLNSARQYNEQDILALRLDDDYAGRDIHISKHALRRLKTLRYLDVCDGHRVVVDGARPSKLFTNKLVLLSCGASSFISRALFHPPVQENLVGLRLHCADGAYRLDKTSVDCVHGTRGCLSTSCFRVLGSPMQSILHKIGNCSKLEFLYVSGCRCVRTLRESFGRLSNLKDLSLLGFTFVHRLPESLGQLGALSVLRLESMGCLRSLPESLGWLKALQKLVLQTCRNLQTLPESFGQLEALKDLQITDCRRLQTLPESFGQLEALKDLQIRDCPGLQTLPESFGQLKALRKLDLNQCGLHSLPVSMGQLKNMRELRLANCRNLDGLPKSFGQLEALNRLELDYCAKLKILPESFGQLQSLCDLQFKGCEELHDLPDSFGRLEALSHLKLEGCPKLKILPESFGQLQALCDLQFIACPGLHTLPESFGQLEALSHLKFGWCKKLTFLPKSFGQLKALSKLEFIACPDLQSLPDSFGQLKALSHLVLMTCPSLQTMPESFDQLKASNHLKMSEATRMMTWDEYTVKERFCEPEDIYDIEDRIKILKGGVEYCRQNS